MGVETVTYDGRPITLDPAVTPTAWQMVLSTNNGYQINLGTTFDEDEIHKYYAEFQKQFGEKPATMKMGYKAFARMKELALKNASSE